MYGTFGPPKALWDSVGSGACVRQGTPEPTSLFFLPSFFLSLVIRGPYEVSGIEPELSMLQGKCPIYCPLSIFTPFLELAATFASCEKKINLVFC